MSNNIFLFILFIFNILFLQNFIVSKNICYNYNFYLIYNFNFLDNNCIIDYNFISPDYIFELFQEKTKKFRTNFKECSIKEIIDYLNYSETHFIKYKKIKHEIPRSLNTLKDKNDLLTGNMTLKQLSRLDNYEKLTQEEINTILENKIKKLNYLPINLQSEYEKYFEYSIFNLFRFYNKTPDYDINSDYIPNICGGRIDLLWTNVNSSDPFWRELYNSSGRYDTINRYRDYNSILYSMRSVYKNIKFVKNWFVVIQSPSQIPYFLDLIKVNDNEYLLNYKNENISENEKIKIHFVYHNEIFPNNSFLPTFSSDAIEAALGFIQNISECFIYLNDDFYIKNPVHPGFFIKPNGKLILYKGYKIAPHFHQSKWDKSITYSNQILNEHYGFKRRQYPIHNFYFMRKSILQEMYETFKVEFSLNRIRKFRESNNVAIPFFHSNFAQIKGYGDEINSNHYLFQYNNYKKPDLISYIFDKIFSNDNLTFFCINDDVKNPFYEKIMFENYHKNMKKLFPEKMPFEK